MKNMKTAIYKIGIVIFIVSMLLLAGSLIVSALSDEGPWDRDDVSELRHKACEKEEGGWGEPSSYHIDFRACNGDEGPWDVDRAGGIGQAR